MATQTFAQQYEQAPATFGTRSERSLSAQSDCQYHLTRAQHPTGRTPYADHPAVERNIQIQKQLEAALQKQTGKVACSENEVCRKDLSFPAKMYLEENSKPLESAAQEVANYLDEKRAYSHSAEW